MSAISNYVHYAAASYAKYGIEVPNADKKDTYNQWASQRAAISARAAAMTKSKISPKMRKDLERTISDIFQRNPANPNIAKVQQDIEKIMQETYKTLTQSIDWNTGGLITSGKPMMGKAHRSYGNSGQLEININKLIKKIDALEKVLQNEINKTSGTTLESLQSKKELLKQYHKELLLILKTAIKNQGRDLNIGSLSDSQLIRNINTYIQEYAAFPPLSKQQGDVLEHAIIMAPQVASTTALQQANIEMKKMGRETVIIDPTHFSKNLSKTIGNMWVNTHATSVEGKVDVQMKWNNKIANISAKNYNLSRSPMVTVSSGSNLIFMLQDANSDFVSHFLNLFAYHIDDNKFPNISVQRQRMFEEIKLMVFYKSISGDNYLRQAADTFVINDTSGTNGVRIYSINDIVQNVIINPELMEFIKISSSKAGLLNDESNLRFKNDWVGVPGIKNFASGLSRIAKLIIDAHQHKLTISFNTTRLL